MADQADTATDDAQPAPPPPELTIVLDPPVKDLIGQDVVELRLQEPTAAQMRECDKYTGYAWMIALVAAVSAHPERVIERLRVSTLNQASAYLSSFIEAGRRTRTAS